MPTIRQVAKACGVSPMTVSFVLNNRPGRVSEETRGRVLSAVREMGYHPSAVKTADRRLTNTLGVVTGVPTESLIGRNYHYRVLLGAMVKADSMRQNVILFTSSLLHVDAHRSIRVYCDGHCDGLIVICPVRESPLVETLQQRGTRFVLAGASPDDPSIPCMDVDNRGEVRRLTEYLINLGHRRIAFCGGPHFVTCVEQRHQGFCQAISDYNIPRNLTLEMTGVHPDHHVPQWISEILRRPISRRPTAIVAWNDEYAVLAIRTALDLGLKVPQDVSITGFDDDEAITASYPDLTTMRQPHARIGAGAVDILLAQIKGDNSESLRRLEPAELVIRGSAAPPGR